MLVNKVIIGLKFIRNDKVYSVKEYLHGEYFGITEIETGNYLILRRQDILKLITDKFYAIIKQVTGLMDLHKLYNMRWRFEWDNSKTRFGCCSFRKREISLSLPMNLLRTDEAIKNTILHEIAHALAPPQVGHGREWKRIALSIGCNAMRCSNDKVYIESKYKATCPKCGNVALRHRLNRGKQSCGKCFPYYNESVLVNWELNN